MFLKCSRVAFNQREAYPTRLERVILHPQRQTPELCYSAWTRDGHGAVLLPDIDRSPGLLQTNVENIQLASPLIFLHLLFEF